MIHVFWIFISVDSRHRPVLPMNGKTPVIDPTAFIATNASVVGDVQMATGSAVWYGAMVRGDNNSIVIGAESHIQDRAIVNGVASTDSGLPGSVAIGSNVVVGMYIIFAMMCRLWFYPFWMPY